MMATYQITTQLTANKRKNTSRSAWIWAIFYRPYVY